jgi:hypothetical protein
MPLQVGQSGGRYQCSIQTEGYMSEVKYEKPFRVVAMEHTDQNESTGNAATRYTITFSDKVNCDWLWEHLDNMFLEHFMEHGGEHEHS